MHKYLVRGNVPVVGPVAVEVLAYDIVSAQSVAKAMFGGKLVVGSVTQIG